MTERLLGLPVRSRRATALASAALFAFYVFTMCRSMSMYDSPELALVAEQLGLGHPFGQPLHSLLGWLFTRLPGIDPLVALNGLSALAGALTVIPVTSFAETLVRPGDDCPSGDVRLIAPTVALLAVHPALWEPSTRIEVYPLAVLLALFAAATFASAVLDRNAARRPYFTTGLALGLAASVNPVCAFGVALAMTPRLLMAVGRKEIPRRSLGLVIAGGLCGLLTYGYVFLVAGRQDAVVWGAPTDAASIRHYFTAADFNSKGVSSWSEWLGHVGELFASWLDTGLVAVFVAGFAGYALYARRRGLGRFFFNATLILFAAFVARDGMFAPDLLDYAGYLSVPTWIAAAGVGLLIAFVGQRSRSYAAGALAAIVVLLLVASPTPFERTRHRDSFTEDIGLAALRAAPPDAIVIVESDHWIGPMWYLQEQRAVRPDVVLLGYGLASSEWYWQRLYRLHPELRPIELRAPGGRVARVRRFLAANAGRPVQVERVALAAGLGLPTCASEWLLDVRLRCPATAEEPALATASRGAFSELGAGSPGTDGLIAAVTLARGHDLYAQGFPRAAIMSLLAGVPGIERIDEVDLALIPARIEPKMQPVPAYEPRVALGHPAQNLHYAAWIATATNATALGAQLLALSEAVGPVQPKFTTAPASPANL